MSGRSWSSRSIPARATRCSCSTTCCAGTAAVRGAPDADVVFVAHHGFPESMAQAWRELPHRTEVEVELWLVPAAQIPADEQERIDWLFSWWADLDAWVAARRESL